MFTTGVGTRARSTLTWSPGGLIGVKHRLHADKAWIADIVWNDGARAVLELAYQFDGPGHSAFGVGLAWSPGSEVPARIGLTWQWEPW